MRPDSMLDVQQLRREQVTGIQMASLLPQERVRKSHTSSQEQHRLLYTTLNRIELQDFSSRTRKDGPVLRKPYQESLQREQEQEPKYQSLSDSRLITLNVPLTQAIVKLHHLLTTFSWPVLTDL